MRRQEVSSVIVDNIDWIPHSWKVFYFCEMLWATGLTFPLDWTWFSLRCTFLFFFFFFFLRAFHFFFVVQVHFFFLYKVLDASYDRGSAFFLKWFLNDGAP